MLWIRFLLSDRPSERFDFSGHSCLDALDLLVLSLSPNFIQVSQHRVHHRFRNICGTFVSKIMSNLVRILRDPIFLFRILWLYLSICCRCYRVHKPDIARIDRHQCELFELLRLSKHPNQPCVFCSVSFNLHLRSTFWQPCHQHLIVILFYSHHIVLLLFNLTFFVK